LAEPSLADRHLYLVCDATFDRVEDALRGGVDILQLRDRTLTDSGLLATARRLAALAHDHGALFFVNDRVDIALLAQADGVHVGQDDLPVARARAIVGPDRLIGRSTHSPAQIDEANQLGLDYIGVGPVYATPTKPGRAPVGFELVGYAAARASLPFFAIGGIDPTNVGAVVEAGASRVAVVRALTQATDPERVAGALRAELELEREREPA